MLRLRIREIDFARRVEADANEFLRERSDALEDLPATLVFCDLSSASFAAAAAA